MAGWYRAHHGTVCDPKWLIVSRRAGEGVTPGHVAAVWHALLEYASQQRPRGRISGFNTKPVAEFFRWPPALVDAIVEALREEGLHDGDALSAWSKRQGGAIDRTAAERKQRQRERERASRGSRDSENARSDASHGMSRRDIWSSHAVTERDDACHGSHDRDHRDPFPPPVSPPYNPPLPTTPNPGAAAAREHAHAHARTRMSPAEIWQALGEAGLPVGIIARTSHARRIAHWLDLSVSRDQLDDAIARAQRARRRAGDARPINIPFIDCFVQDVVDGIPEQQPQQSRKNHAGDELSRQFAAGG